MSPDPRYRTFRTSRKQRFALTRCTRAFGVRFRDDVARVTRFRENRSRKINVPKLTVGGARCFPRRRENYVVTRTRRANVCWKKYIVLENPSACALCERRDNRTFGAVGRRISNEIHTPANERKTRCRQPRNDRELYRKCGGRHVIPSIICPSDMCPRAKVVDERARQTPELMFRANDSGTEAKYFGRITPVFCAGIRSSSRRGGSRDFGLFSIRFNGCRILYVFYVRFGTGGGGNISTRRFPISYSLRLGTFNPTARPVVVNSAIAPLDLTTVLTSTTETVHAKS